MLPAVSRSEVIWYYLLLIFSVDFTTTNGFIFRSGFSYNSSPITELLRTPIAGNQVCCPAAKIYSHVFKTQFYHKLPVLSRIIHFIFFCFSSQSPKQQDNIFACSLWATFFSITELAWNRGQNLLGFQEEVVICTLSFVCLGFPQLHS